MNPYDLTIYQLAWLKSKGGRNSSDVEKDEKGLYILMGDGNGGLKKVYIPKN